ncbi:MAG: Rieske 2Fe-2S domain-containing protein [Pirellulales bacterium]|nr:Rieske 2Fe-2S domain-containing protein [Pirellulales bacterium]
MADLADMAGKEIAPPEESPRRNFLVSTWAIIIGAIVTVFPFAAGLGVLFDPLRRKAAKAESIRITTLDALPDDGVPRAFPVIDTRVDAWNLYPPEAIGSVYLKRDAGQAKPVAWTTVCPHLGCAVDFKADAREFQCPCHVSAFDLNGNTLTGPSPRGLDSLEVEVRDENEVWVKYERFRSGITAKTVEE